MKKLITVLFIALLAALPLLAQRSELPYRNHPLWDEVTGSYKDINQFADNEDIGFSCMLRFDYQRCRGSSESRRAAWQQSLQFLLYHPNLIPTDEHLSYILPFAERFISFKKNFKRWPPARPHTNDSSFMLLLQICYQRRGEAVL